MASLQNRAISRVHKSQNRVTFLLVTFSWLFRGPHLLGKIVFGLFFCGFFVASSWPSSPWKNSVWAFFVAFFVAFSWPSFGDKFGESLVGSQAPPSFWEVPGLPRKFPELPRKFSATSPEVLSLWNLTAIRRVPGSFPNFPGSSPNFPGSSGTSPEVSPSLWEA